MQEKAKSAVLRIKESLSYKLGSALIEYNQNGGGLSLFLKLITIIKTYKRTQRLYKDFITLYPHLKYPPIEQCSDYKEALKYKFHLSYLLGQALIKANRTWYKGGYIKFYFCDIQRAKQDYQEFKALDEEHILESHYLTLIFENKDKLKFFKEYKNEFKTLLNDFNDYEALKEVFISNLSSTYFIQNLNTIKEWLYSKEFKQNYQDKNHPYPSLLNPNKIDYNTIPAELAWEMNLPLPRNYEFIILRGHGVGGLATTNFLTKCKVIIGTVFHRIYAKDYFLETYNILLDNTTQPHCVRVTDYRNLQLVIDNGYARDKVFLLIDKKVPILFQVRDPIAMIKHAWGRRWGKLEKTWQTTLCLKDKDFLEKIPIINTARKEKEFILPKLRDMFGLKRQVFIQNSLANAFKHSGEITYLDMSEISKEKAFDTMTKLSQKFGFDSPKEEDRHFFEMKAHGIIHHILPLTLLARAKDIGAGNEEVKIEISVPEENTTQLDLTKEVIDFIPLQDFAFYITQEDYEILKNNDKLFEATKNYLKDFAYKLDERMKLEDSLMLNEKDVLEYLRNNKQARLDLKSILDEELAHVKAHRPDIVASWKYYQEFESMCEELDGKKL